MIRGSVPAAIALREIAEEVGTEAAPALPQLEEALKDEDDVNDEFRTEVARALAAIGYAKA